MRIRRIALTVVVAAAAIGFAPPPAEATHGDCDDVSFSWLDSNSDGMVGAGDTGVSVTGGSLKLDLHAIVPADWTLFGEAPEGSITLLGVTSLSADSFTDMFA